MPAAVGTINLDHPRPCPAPSDALALVGVHTSRRSVGADFGPAGNAFHAIVTLPAVRQSTIHIVKTAWPQGEGMGRQCVRLRYANLWLLRSHPVIACGDLFDASRPIGLARGLRPREASANALPSPAGRLPVRVAHL